VVDEEYRAFGGMILVFDRETEILGETPVMPLGVA
jgi:hypothetical protein